MSSTDERTRAQILIDRSIDALFWIDALTWLGIAVVAAIWGLLALWKCARGMWVIRAIGLGAIGSAVVLLLVDSPLSARLPVRIGSSEAGAMALLLAGGAFLALIVTHRQGVVEMVKQLFVAAAFILWGVDLLMPAGQWATFVGGVVVAIYVFDLVWLIEANLRRTVRPRGGGVTYEPSEFQSGRRTNRAAS